SKSILFSAKAYGFQQKHTVSSKSIMFSVKVQADLSGINRYKFLSLTLMALVNRASCPPTD
ncbi:MAG: hypothetical protein WCP66_05595, partial [Methylococcales bacterium]